MPLPPPDLNRLLVRGARVTTGCGPGTGVEPLGAELSLPSGEVVASGRRWEPVGFTETAPPGRYPVPRAVKLVIRDAPVASWTMSLLPGQDPSGLDERNFCGFPVDGGEASLIDARYLRELNEAGTFLDFREDANADLDFGGPLEPFEDEDGRDAVVFRTGDGTYPTRIGHTADGELACYVITFGISDERD